MVIVYKLVNKLAKFEINIQIIFNCYMGEHSLLIQCLIICDVEFIVVIWKYVNNSRKFELYIKANA